MIDLLIDGFACMSLRVVDCRSDLYAYHSWILHENSTRRVQINFLSAENRGEICNFPKKVMRID